MAKNDDELLLGTAVPSGKGARDSDGDGVSDAEEELAGTDPSSADPARRELDPRADLERPDLEREVAFDPAGAMPEGQSITGGLDGLTNLDGSAIPTGTNHHGVGEDALLQGRDTHSPLDMERSPLGGTDGGNGPAVAGGGPALSGRAPNWDLVSEEGDGGDGDAGGDAGGQDWEPTPDTPPAPTPEPWQDMFDPEKHTPAPPADDPPEQDWDPKDGQRDPDAGGTGPVTEDDIGAAIVRAGGDTKPVEGEGAGPQIDDELLPDKGDLVTDPGDDDGSATAGGTGTMPGGRPDAPVVRTINPDSGVVAPPTGGPPPPGGGGNTGQVVDRTAADLGGDGFQSMDGTADLSSVVDDHLEIDTGNLPDDGIEHETGDLGGPLDDGFD